MIKLASRINHNIINVKSTVFKDHILDLKMFSVHHKTRDCDLGHLSVSDGIVSV